MWVNGTIFNISFPSCASLPRCGDETQARGQQRKRDTMTEEKVETAVDAGPSPSKGMFFFRKTVEIAANVS